MKKRLLLIVLSALLLAGCGKMEEPPAVPEPESEEPFIEEPVVEEPVIEEPVIAATLDGKPVTMEELSPYIALSVDNLIAELGIESIDWTDGDKTISDYVKKDALEILRLYTAIEKEGERLGFASSAEEKADIESWHRDAVRAVGSELAYQQYLADNHMTDEVYTRIYAVNLLYEDLYAYYYGEDGKDLPTDEELFAWAAEQGIYHISHIFLSTEDAPEDIAIRQQQLAVKINNALKNGADFYEMAAQYSEAEGFLNQYVMLDEAQEEIKKVLLTLDVEQNSGVLESETGYHILRREQVERSYILDNFPEYVAERFNALISRWTEEIEISTTEEFDAFFAGDIFS